MAPRKRSLTKRLSALDENSLAWLRGDWHGCNVFFMGKPSSELAPLWEEYGDKENMYWRPGMRLPQPIDELELS